MSDESNAQLDREALLFHSEGRPGKIEIIASKPMATQRDLALAYSPGVAAPVHCASRKIEGNGLRLYRQAATWWRVISNGTAILGLGNLGALASKPVMEGKAVLFKRFADVDAIDLEARRPTMSTAFINCDRADLGPKLRRDQPGGYQGAGLLHYRADSYANSWIFRCSTTTSTAPRSSPSAGLINACLDLTGRRFGDTPRWRDQRRRRLGRLPAPNLSRRWA